jgi:hypothetical protein
MPDVQSPLAPQIPPVEQSGAHGGLPQKPSLHTFVAHCDGDVHGSPSGQRLVQAGGVVHLPSVQTPEAHWFPFVQGVPVGHE